jgi:hypothetical protein
MAVLPFTPALPPLRSASTLTDVTDVGFRTVTFVLTTPEGAATLVSLHTHDNKLRCLSGVHRNNVFGQTQCEHMPHCRTLLGDLPDDYFQDHDAHEDDEDRHAHRAVVGMSSRPCVTTTPISLPLHKDCGDHALVHDSILLSETPEELYLCQLDCDGCGTLLTHQDQLETLKVLLVARTGEVTINTRDGFCPTCQLVVPFIDGGNTGVFVVHPRFVVSLAFLVHIEHTLVHCKVSFLSMYKVFVADAAALGHPVKQFSYPRFLRAIWGFLLCRYNALALRPGGLFAACISPVCESEVYPDIIVGDGLKLSPYAERFPMTPAAPTGDTHPRGVNASIDPADPESGRFFFHGNRVAIVAWAKTNMAVCVLVARVIPVDLFAGHEDVLALLQAFCVPKVLDMTVLTLKTILSFICDLASDSYIDAACMGADLSALHDSLVRFRHLVRSPQPPGAAIVACLDGMTRACYYFGKAAQTLNAATGFSPQSRRTILANYIDVAFGIVTRVIARPSRLEHWRERGECSACSSDAPWLYMICLRPRDREPVAPPIVELVQVRLRQWFAVQAGAGQLLGPGVDDEIPAFVPVVNRCGTHLQFRGRFASIATAEEFLQEWIFGPLVLIRANFECEIVVDDVNSELAKSFPFSIGATLPVRPICKVFETGKGPAVQGDKQSCRKIDVSNKHGRGGHGSILFCCSHLCIFNWTALEHHESSRNVYDVVRSYWPFAPRAIVYDTACVAATFAQIRDYNFFQSTIFSVDRLHVNYHTGCSRAHHPSSHPILDEINTVVCEEVNELVRPFKHNIQHATFPHFKIASGVIGSHNNDRANEATKKKLARIGGARQ